MDNWKRTKDRKRMKGRNRIHIESVYRSEDNTDRKRIERE